jgi:hypothetical protein
LCFFLGSFGAGGDQELAAIVVVIPGHGEGPARWSCAGGPGLAMGMC